MQNHKLEIVVASKKSRFEDTQTGKSFIRNNESEWNSVIYHQINDNGITCYETPKYIISFFGDNKKGLGELYSKIVNDTLNRYVVFVHDDVSFHTGNLKQDCIDAMQLHDVAGVAGAPTIKFKCPYLWHLMATTRSGCVMHNLPNGRYFGTSFGDIGQPCMLLDGVFLVVNIDKLRNFNVNFDSSFTFHHYDLDFSLSSYFRGLRIATYPFFITHYSPGLKTRDETFNNNEKMFYEKWKTFFMDCK